MLDKATIHTLRNDIAPQYEPLLSLYLDIHPTKPENARGAPLIRVKDELKRLGLSKTFAEALLTKLGQMNDLAQAKTLVAFVAEDMKAFCHLYLLRLELPQLQKSGILARWGKPHITPLMQFIDAQERYGIVFIDQQRWRYFEVFFGDIEEKQDAFRALDTTQWRTFTEANAGVAHGVMARGGMGKDHFAQRKDDWTHRFYKEVARLLGQSLKTNHVHHLVLLGPTHYLSDFKNVLPKDLQNKIIATLPQPPHPAVSANEMFNLVAPSLEHFQQEKEKSLLEQITEKSVHGLAATLTALQEGRLQTVITSWQSDHTVYLCSESGYVAATLADVEKNCPDGHHRLELLQEVLPELAETFAARLTYVHGEAEKQISETFDGVAGLGRW